MKSKKKGIARKSRKPIKQKKSTPLQKFQRRFKKLELKGFFQRVPKLSLRTKAIILALIILLAILTIAAIFLSSRRLSQSEVDNKYNEIETVISKEDYANTSYLESSLTFLEDYNDDLKDKSQSNLVEAKSRLLLIKEYSGNQDYEKACDYVKSYIKQTEDDPQVSIVSSAKVSVNLAFSLITISSKCEDVSIEKVTKLTGFQRFKYEDKIILSYYDNIVSEQNARWISTTFDQDINEIKLDDENHRDAIRILIIKKEDSSPIAYKQFRSEKLEQSYFDRQFETFDLNEGKLYWKSNGDVALDLNILK